MPKSKLQNVLFTIVMAFVMVYALVCYNIALDKGGMSNEIVIMLPVAFVLEFFIVEKFATKLAFRIVTPQDRPIFITLAISSMIVCIMCPIMSFIATLLFAHAGNQLIAVWIQKTFMNFPVAFFWQIFIAGPLVRNLFGLFNKKSK